MFYVDGQSSCNLSDKSQNDHISDKGVANSTAVLGHTLKAVLIFYSQILNLVQVVYPQCEQQIFSIVMSLCLHFDSLQLTID